jgi:16S rRNA A1518/A1519 N6-dimethyltransferase RsmA/KsgA/DIM1 with predicted DNA glycosylase/AP lyase activity
VGRNENRNKRTPQESHANTESYREFLEKINYKEKKMLKNLIKKLFPIQIDPATKELIKDLNRDYPITLSPDELEALFLEQ